MSKAGVETLTKHLAFELSHHGVRVNCVSPGMIDSNFLVYRSKELMNIE
jgi:Dehydrogenases with different specificities (related to short-chain alcohol dehydrogenases)